MRMAAERLPSAKTAFTGASKPGTRRRYELVVGLVSARSDEAWSRIPAMYAKRQHVAPPLRPNGRRGVIGRQTWSVGGG